MSPSSDATTDVISIVIPTYNGVEYLRRCIHALREHTKATYRLYIADDCSPSTELRKYLSELKRSGQAVILRSKVRRNFPDIINWAVKQVPGDICLLDADTEPMQQWLTHMQQELQADPRIGLVGALLVYPETKGKPLGGTIQHAGVARTSQKHPYHPFRGKSLSCEEANVRRELNAVTGACILIRRKVWEDLKGFDEGFEGGQFEDTDFCWRARKAGWKVVYQPKAILCHFENGLGPESAGRGDYNLQRLVSQWPELRSDEDLFQGKNSAPKSPKSSEGLSSSTFEIPKDLGTSKHLRLPRSQLLIREGLERWPPKIVSRLTSVIVVTYNTLEITADCVRSVLDKTIRSFELIVVDNGSKDGSVEWLEKQNCLTLIANEENLGWAAANNQGIWHSRGEYCLLLNSDTIVRTRGWLREMIRLAQPDDVATVGAKLLYADGRIQHIGGSIHRTNPFHPFDGASADTPESLEVREVPFNTGACLLIKKSAIELVGLIDEGYKLGYGDVDYGLRCLEAGLKNIYCPTAVLTHLWAYTQRKTGKWIPPESLARYRQLWTEKLPALSKKVDMDFRWPDAARDVRTSGPGSHISKMRKKEAASGWTGILAQSKEEG